MTATAVVTDRCQGCGACLLTCPERAIRPARPAPAPGRARVADTRAPSGAIDPARRPARLIVLEECCTGCGECVEICPVDAISLACILGQSGRKYDSIR